MLIVVCLLFYRKNNVQISENVDDFYKNDLYLYKSNLSSQFKLSNNFSGNSIKNNSCRMRKCEKVAG